MSDAKTRDELLEGIKAVVQYRRKDEGIYWNTMAAFDSLDVAEKYANRCSEGDIPWEYRALELPEINP